MPNILVIGATRGLGYELSKQYAERNDHTVVGTARGDPPKDAPSSIQWITGVHVGEKNAGQTLVNGLKNQPQDIIIISAGYFGKETFENPDYDAEVTMYKTSAIGPVFIVHALFQAGLLRKGAKVILVSSESGSIALRHETEGGGMYAHHASKAALNMVGKLLSLDLKPHGVAVALVHPAFMRTEMTAGVGFDEFWDSGGAVEPSESAKSLIEWVDGFDISQTGEYWAPRGAGDIGTAEHVLGSKDKLPTPLQLPW